MTYVRGLLIHLTEHYLSYHLIKKIVNNQILWTCQTQRRLTRIAPVLIFLVLITRIQKKNQLLTTLSTSIMSLSSPVMTIFVDWFLRNYSRSILQLFRHWGFTLKNFIKLWTIDFRQILKWWLHKQRRLFLCLNIFFLIFYLYRRNFSFFLR